MNSVNPKKLLNSKWTALNPKQQEKHFMVCRIEFEKNGSVNHCQMQAVLTKRYFLIDWQALKNSAEWQHGWN